MASFTKQNPQFDGNSASFFGKVPDYVEINFGSSVAGSNCANLLSTQNLNTNGAWPDVIQVIEQNAIIEVLGQVQANCVLISQNGGNANIGVRLLVSGVNAVSGLQSAIQALGNVVIGNATVGYSNVNFQGVTVASTTIGNIIGVPGTSTFYF
jgi:hypothetical protein